MGPMLLHYAKPVVGFIFFHLNTIFQIAYRGVLAGLVAAACAPEAWHKPAEYPERPLSAKAPKRGDVDGGLAPGHLNLKAVLAGQDAQSLKELCVWLDERGVVAKLSLEGPDPKSVPKAVLDRFAERFPGLPPDDLKVEWHSRHGKVFELETDVPASSGLQECDLAIKASGAVLYESCEIDPKDLPVELSQAIAAMLARFRTPRRAFDEAEHRKYADGREDWHVELKALDASGKTDDETPALYLVMDDSGKVARSFRAVPTKAYVPAVIEASP